jgi:di- and tripeptidase
MSPSDGRDQPPKPLCTLQTPTPSSVLSLACDDVHLFAGAAPGIDVWEIGTFALVTSLLGHSGGVLCLETAREKSWLFSSSSDNSVRIWSTKSLSALYVVDTATSGDIFSLAWLPELHTLYMGSQDATISVRQQCVACR